MGRYARQFSGSGIYHVMFRGLNKQKIFLESWDYEKLLEILTNLKEELEFEVYAYCLMSNHAHFIIKEKNLRDISEIMHRMLTKYARWFNIKYDRTGTLMENRYKSRVVEVDEYFVHVIRYVHQNPVKAGIVENIADYPWSSYGDYVSKKQGLTDTAFLFDMMSESEFIPFHAIEEEMDLELNDRVKPTDDDLREELKRLGITEMEQLKYISPMQLEFILAKLREKFSDRHINRVTEIGEYKLRQIKRH